MNASRVVADKPLHVSVAEAIGWYNVTPEAWPNPSEWGGMFGKMPLPAGADSVLWNGVPLDAAPARWGRIPHYDTDWNAAGPLVEKYRLKCYPDRDEWIVGTVVTGEKILGRSDSLPSAVCLAILSLKAEGVE